MRRRRRTPLGGNQRYIRRVQEFSDNLVGYYPGKETSGTTVYDYSGNGNDGVASGVDLTVPGIGDGLTGMGFDGATSYADISAIASNVIANGGFETAGGGGADVHASWTENAGDGAIANETVTVHTGSDALKLTAGASTDTYDDQTVTVVDGSRNKIRLWVYGDGSDPARYSIYDVSNSASIQALTSIGSTAAAWTMVDIEFDAPAGCTSARLRLQCPDANGGIAYFDTISLRRVDVPTFDGHEGTVIIHVKLPSSAWTSGDFYRFLALKSFANQTELYIAKSNSYNVLAFQYKANNVSEFEAIGGYSTTDWMTLAMRWSLSGDYIEYFEGGSQIGSTQTGLGVWPGLLNGSFTTVGAGSTGAANPTLGDMAHVAILNTPLSDDEIAYLSRTP